MADDLFGTDEELPELEGVALEPPTVPTVIAPPAAAAPTPQVSAKELTDDILGGVDFDLPAAPSAVPKATVAPKSPAAPPAFKPPAALFGQSGGFGTSGLKPQPLAAKPVAAPPPPVAAVDTRAIMSDLGAGDKDALRAALTSDTPPQTLPPDAMTAMFHLARALIKKGIVTVDELIP